MTKRHESVEDYLERILMLNQRLGNVRSIDIANDMSFSKPSVSIAMKKLRESDYIQIDSNGFITLTEEGYRIASEIYDRHQTLAETLIALGVDEKTAFQDACRVEHDLSQESFDKIKSYYRNSIKK